MTSLTLPFPPAALSPNQCSFQEVEPRRVTSFVERWHYSKRMPTGQNFVYEWLINGELYAVAVYGIGVNAYQAKFLGVDNASLIELKRLCRKEPKIEGYPLTRFLGWCHRRLKRAGYRCVVSFSDPAHSHHGGIYRAANFTHAGKTNGEWHVQDAEGEVRHRRYAFRYARRNGISIGEARDELGLVRAQTPPKDRWVLMLKGKGRNRQVEASKQMVLL